VDPSSKLQPNEGQRQEGRKRACEGLLASRFGERQTQAGSKAIAQLRSLQAAPTGLSLQSHLSSLKTWLTTVLHPSRTLICNPQNPSPSPWSWANCWLATATMLPLMMLGLGFWFLHLRNAAQLTVVQASDPGVSVVRQGRMTKVDRGFRIRSGDILRARSLVSLSLEFNGRPVRIDAQPNSELVFCPRPQTALARLNRGSIDVQVEPNAARPITLLTPHADVLVQGTHFHLAARSTSTWLEVQTGKVELIRHSDGQQVQVGPNYRAVAAPGLEMAVHPCEERWQTPYVASLPSHRS
jgi:hypothetical protein